MTFWDELSKLQKKSYPHYVYFQYKNKIEHYVDYGAKTEEDILKAINRKSLKSFEKWESTPEYKRLKFLLYEDKFYDDILDVYESVKELAKSGDNQATKNLLYLQEEIRQYRESLDNYLGYTETEEDEELQDILKIMKE